MDKALQKDCHCLDTIHTGPHWIHMNYVTKQMNYDRLQKSIDKNNGYLNWSMYRAFMEAEHHRLEQLFYDMSRYKVDHIPDEFIVEIELPKFKE